MRGLSHASRDNRCLWPKGVVMSAIELATGYITLTVAANDVAKELARSFADGQQLATRSGAAMGKAMSESFAKAAPSVADLSENYERAQTKVTEAAKRAAAEQENLARKVAIAEAKKTEAVAKYGEKSSQALTAIDRLALAEQKLEAASLKAASEQERLSRGAREAGRALEDAQMAARGAGTQLEKLDDSIDVGAFRRKFDVVEKETHDTFDRVGRGAATRFGEGFRSSFAGNLLANVAQNVLSGVKDFFAGIISESSGVEQAVGGVGAIFQETSGQIEAAAAGADKTLGLSRRSYDELASVLGAQLKNKGIKDFADQTQSLIGLGADLAAQFGGDTKTAVEAISSLMRGEADPIEKYGVSISETAVSARLAADGLSGLEGAELEQAKAQTRLKLLFEQTSDAQGAFARESDTLAGKQQRLGASWDNLKAALGDRLMPVASAFTGWLSDDVLPAIDKVSTGFDGLWGIIAHGDFDGDVWGKLGVSEDDPRIGVLFTIRDGVQGVWDIIAGGDFNGDVWSRLGISEDAPMVGVLFTLREAAQGFIDTIGNGWSSHIEPALDGLRDKFGNLWSAVQPIFAAFAEEFNDRWARWGPTIKGYWDQITQIVGDAINLVSAHVQSVTDAIGWVWSNFGDTIMNVARAAWDQVMTTIGGVLDIIQGMIRTVTAIMNGDWSGAMDGICLITSGAWQIISGIFTSSGELVKAILAGVGDWLAGKVGEIRDWVVSGFQQMADGVGAAWGRIKELAAKPVNFVIEAVYNDGIVKLVNGFLDVFPGEQKRLPTIDPIKFAEGGFTRGSAAISGRPVLWGEVPGVDEAYIPLDGAARSRSIWLEAGRRLGMLAMAKGGIIPVNGVQTSGYGSRVGPFNGAEFHDGVDIGAGAGTPVIAALDGVVVFAGVAGGYGNMIRLDHGNGLQTFYAHLQDINVALGQTVKQAQRIGSVGSTGWSTGPHLHFGASQNGASIDPMSVVSGEVSGGGFLGLLAGLPGKIKEIRDGLAELGGSVWGGLLRNAASSLLDMIPGWAQNLFGSEKQASFDAGAGAQQWASVALQAMQMAGLPASYLPLLLHRIDVESGGNPNAINLWDINAQMGMPSQGLMQTIPPTFAAYAGPLVGRGITDPLANIYAAIMYTLDRYGLAGIERAWGGRQGYWTGTRSARPGIALVGEKGPELVRFGGGERVWNNTDTEQILWAGGGVHIHVTAQGDDLDQKLRDARWAATHDITDGLRKAVAYAG